MIKVLPRTTTGADGRASTGEDAPTSNGGPSVTSEEGPSLELQPGTLFPFTEDLFSPSPPSKLPQTRGQRRQQASRGDTISPCERLMEAQRSDLQIQEWKAAEKPERYLEQSGVLCRRWRPKHGHPRDHCNQIVLPPSYWAAVLCLAHDVPMAGHLGRERILARLHQRFWWLGIATDVAEYCRTCEECQTLS